MARQVPARKITYYVREIKQHWQKAVEGIFTVCQLVAEAKEQLSTVDWEQLKDGLPFSDSVLKKLIIIGNDKRLQKSKFQKLLPPSYSIIYEVTQLNDDELSKAINEGGISPRMSRTEFIDWRKQIQHTQSQSTSLASAVTPRLGPNLFAGVALPSDFPDSQFKNLKSDLEKITRRYGLSLVYGIAEKEFKEQAKQGLALELRAKFISLVDSHDQNLQPDELDMITDAHLQFFALQYHDPMPYPPEHPSSIEHPDHPFSIQSGWDQKRFHDELRKRKIVTPWAPISKRKGLGEAKCIQFAFQYLEAKTPAARAKHLKALQNIVKARDTNSDHAAHCLAQVQSF